MSSSTVLPAAVTLTNPPIVVRLAIVDAVGDPLPALCSVGGADQTVVPGAVG